MEADMLIKEQNELAQGIMKKLEDQHQTVAFATDFLTSFAITAIDQSTSFAGLVVALTDDAKNAMFDIPYQILNANGPHSEETAIWMARQEKAALRTDYAIAVTRDAEKHTFWIAMIDNEDQVSSCPLPFYRAKNAENKAFQKALNLMQQAVEK